MNIIIHIKSKLKLNKLDLLTYKILTNQLKLTQCLFFHITLQIDYSNVDKNFEILTDHGRPLREARWGTCPPP